MHEQVGGQFDGGLDLAESAQRCLEVLVLIPQADGGVHDRAECGADTVSRVVHALTLRRRRLIGQALNEGPRSADSTRRRSRARNASSTVGVVLSSLAIQIWSRTPSAAVRTGWSTLTRATRVVPSMRPPYTMIERVFGQIVPTRPWTPAQLRRTVLHYGPHTAPV